MAWAHRVAALFFLLLLLLQVCLSDAGALAQSLLLWKMQHGLILRAYGPKATALRQQVYMGVANWQAATVSDRQVIRHTICCYVLVYMLFYAPSCC